MFNANNERIKRRYFEYRREASRNDEETIDAVADAISSFEKLTNFADFGSFDKRAAIRYKAYLRDYRTARHEPLSKATMHARCLRLRAFFIWLAVQPGFKSKISFSDAEYFNLSEKDVRMATARRERPWPTQNQLLAAFNAMPDGSEVELRDRAVVALIALTGVRDHALTTLKMKHLNLDKDELDFDARSVSMKFGKSFKTWFLPVDPVYRLELVRWEKLRREVHLAGADDALFPATRTMVGEHGKFEVVGLSGDPWADAGPVRNIFRRAFGRVGLPYFNPHSVRNMLAALGENLCGNAEQFKAWSQNLGHENVLTTLTSYGSVPGHRQQEIMREFVRRVGSDTNASFEEDLLALLEKHKRLRPA